MIDRRNIQHLYIRLLQKIKNFLFSTQSREFLVFLFFFFIAAGFWLIQTLNDDYEVELSIPVRLKGMPNNVVITSENATDLRVRVKDKGTVLVNYMVAKSFLPITLNYNDYKTSNNHIRVFASQFEKQVQARLSVSSVVRSIKPDTLEYIYTTGKSRLVPVKLRGKVHAGRQYYISDTVYSPDSVLVYAPKHVLDTITAAYTVPVTLDDVTDTLKQQVSLAIVKGAKFIPEQVEVTLPVDIYTDKTVEVPVYGTNFPADKVLRAFPAKVNVTFQVGLGRYRYITADDFVVHVSYEELMRIGSRKYTVKLKSVPRGVSNIRISPEQVDFLIEQVSPNGN